MFTPVRGLAFLLVLFLLQDNIIRAQRRAAICFWNVENLFDTIDDPRTNDHEFTPGGKNVWTTQRYLDKLQRLSEVIGALGTDDTKSNPAVIGLCEVENERVLADLVNTGTLKKAGFRYLHRDSPDERGIDVCMLYDPLRFSVDTFYTVAVRLPNGHPTRDIFVATGSLMNEPLAIVVNHWPSRRGGEKSTRILRKTAAAVALRICDSLYRSCPACGVIMMGDFNDDPTGRVVKTLVDRTDTIRARHIRFTNPMTGLFARGIGSLAWNDSWNLFDQVLLSDHFYDKRGWSFSKASVVSDERLRAATGRFAGYPFRTFAAGVYQGGYSDHFPVYVVLDRK